MSIFIIAEIGINHNGDLNIAKQLIDVAKEAGCDAVKFQKRDIDIVYTQEYLDGPRESQWGETQRDQKKGLEFEEDDYNEINIYCKKKGIEWFASAWDLNSQKFLKKYNLKYNKIASAMNIYGDLLEEVAKEQRHTFISTGLCEMDDIENAVNIFKKLNCPFELMHCVSEYPLPAEKVNLKMINTLKKKFGCNIGYSGHEVGLPVAVAAAAMNISSLERHITLDRSMYGSDQSASIEPHGLKKLVQYVRVVEEAMGDGIKKFDEQEQKISKKLREHLKI
jgi:N-acetylneuraminate synthase